jgi:hypothetical protein
MSLASILAPPRTPMIVLMSALALGSGTARAGADASEDATVSYRVDLSRPFDVYHMTDRDRAWSRSLTARLRYTGKVVHFVRTSLPLAVDGKTVEGAVYQAVELPGYFYVADGDAMLRVGARWPYSPDVGGLSMHAPRSRHFIVCLHFQRGGVPFRSSTPVIKGEIRWKGNHVDHPGTRP